MNALDELVRRSLLSYPLIFATRWDVLRHLFLVIGNGYDWLGGQLVDEFARPFDEEQARATFFEDLDSLEAEFGESPDSRLRRAQRQLQFDHIDDLVEESPHMRGQQITVMDLYALSPEYAQVFCVPDDVEPSFRDGAIEVLSSLNKHLYLAAVQFKELRPVHVKVQTELVRLRGMR